VLAFSVLLLLLGLIILWLARQRRKASGLPGGRIIYTDTRGWGRVEKPLFDPELGLTGKPDYLVEQGSQLIPVEVKSSRAAEAPYDSHIFQLAAYCYLVQVTYEKRPEYGILKYANRTFAIDYTPELEAGLKELLAEIRSQEQLKSVNRSHQSVARCQACGYRATCDQKLF
jgi:CRISPR-associated exonuclease Cas4